MLTILIPNRDQIMASGYKENAEAACGPSRGLGMRCNVVQSTTLWVTSKFKCQPFRMPRWCFPTACPEYINNYSTRYVYLVVCQIYLFGSFDGLNCCGLLRIQPGFGLPFPQCDRRSHIPRAPSEKVANIVKKHGCFVFFGQRRMFKIFSDL